LFPGKLESLKSSGKEALTTEGIRREREREEGA